MSVETDLAQGVLELIKLLPREAYNGNPSAVDLWSRQAQAVINQDKANLKFGSVLRIIYRGDDDYPTYKVADVVDNGDRFIVTKSNSNYHVIEGVALKKGYLHYTIATPEKEALLETLQALLRAVDKTRSGLLRKIFE